MSRKNEELTAAASDDEVKVESAGFRVESLTRRKPTRPPPSVAMAAKVVSLV